MARPLQFRWFQPVIAIVFGAMLLAYAAFCQTNSSAPPVATKVAANVPNGQQQPSSEITTIRAYSNLVVIDVVVTDSKQNPVHGLQLSDFSLTENNKPQTVRHFEEHSASSANDTGVVPPPSLPPGLFTNKSPAPANGPVNVLLLDYLNTPLTAQPYARKQLLDYLNKAPAGTRIAIFALTTKLSMLQGFTSDMNVLKAALIAKKGAPQFSDILNDPVNGGQNVDTTLSNILANDPTASQGMVTQEMVDDINRFEAMQSSFQQDMIARYTLGAFDTLARYLVGIPGRKNVIWFSGGFPLDIEPNANEADPNDSVVRNDDEVRKTDNLLTRAQVAVYPVDARGIQTDPSQNFAAQGGITNINEGTGAASANNTMTFLNQTAAEHNTMEAMAEDTGGQAFINTNDLSTAVHKAIENGSNYYTLTYAPTNMEWDGRFRSVKVKVDQPGVKLSYRNGYFAVDPNDRNKVYAGTAATAVAQQPTTMATAMMHGGPDPAEILFKVRIRPANTPPEETPLKTNQTNPDPKVKVQGPFREYGVDLVPDARAVSCRADTPTGNRHCALEVWTFVYNTDGERLITASNRLHTVLTPADYAKLLSGGMAFHQEISVPVRGQYFVRTAIHDMVSDRVGAVEVPVAAFARLEPLAAPPTVTAPTVPMQLPADQPSGASSAPASGAGTAAPAAPASAEPSKAPDVSPTGASATPK